MSEKCYSIEFWRIIFCVIVILLHIENSTALGIKYFQNGYYGVEFFFILSGFLLLRSFKQKAQSNTMGGYLIKSIQCAVNKFSNISIVYYFTLLNVFMYRLYFYIYVFEKENIVEYIKNLLAELFVVNGIYYKDFHINGPDWYISVFIISTAIIAFTFYLLGKYRGYPCLLLLIGIFGCGCLKAGINTPYPLMVRGISEMMLGGVAYYIYELLKDIEFSKFKYMIINAVEVISIIIIMILIFDTRIHSSNIDIIVPVICLIVICFLNKSVISNMLSNDISNFLGKISMPMYLGQMLVIVKFGWNPEFDLLQINRLMAYIIILCGCFLYAYDIHIMTNIVPHIKTVNLNYKHDIFMIIASIITLFPNLTGISKSKTYVYVIVYTIALRLIAEVCKRYSSKNMVNEDYRTLGKIIMFLSSCGIALKFIV